MDRLQIAALMMSGFAADSAGLYFGTNEKPHNPWIWCASEALKAADELIKQNGIILEK